LRLRVLAAAGTIALVSAVTFGLLLNALLAQNRAAVPARAVTEARNAIGDVQRLSQDLETGARGYLLTGDDTFLGSYETARRELLPVLDKLAGIRREGDQRARIVVLRQQLAAYMDALAGAVADRDDSPATAENLRRGFDEVRGTLGTLDSAEREELLRRRAESADLRRRSIITASIGFAVLLALIGLISYGAVRAVVIPVGRLQRFARALGARRYGARLPESGPPETVELAQAFNATAVSLEAAEAELRRIGERHLAELDAVFREAPLGLAFVDRELRYLRVNDALARMNGKPAAEHIGTRVQHPDAVASLERVIATGQPVLDVEVAVDGRRFEASYFPVRAGGDDLVAVGAAVSDVEARRRAEDARERLQHATAALAATVVVDDVGRATVAEARRALGAANAAVMMVEGEQLVLLRHGGLSETDEQRWATVPLRARLPIAEAATLAKPVFAGGRHDIVRRWPPLADDPPQALAMLPLVDYSGRVMAVLGIAFDRPMRFDPSERALLESLAAQCAVALARAQLYEREHSVAQTLQASLLPRKVPKLGGMDLAARLNAGAPGIEVGGDFYDVFEIALGTWGIAIGDVCGKGVDAAALTALARHTVRAAAVQGLPPSAVLGALNRAVLAEGRPGQFLTAIFARVSERPGGGFDLTVACGGHPPPVLLAASGATKPLDVKGTLLGVLDDPHVHDVTTVLESGDLLLLYTDGLTEAGAPAVTLSTEEVADLVRAARAPTAAETVENCLQVAAQAGGGVVRDDVAVVVGQVV
jgi:CHASE3 domain sensor protein